MKLKLDYSALSCFRTCPTKFLYRYAKGLVPQGATAEALEFGKLFHLGLERLYKLGFPGGAQAEEVINTLPTGGLSPAPEVRRGTEHLRQLLRAYVSNYHPEVLRLVQFETFAELPINDWLTYCGTIDGLLDDGTVFETKTTSFLGGSFLERMRPNDQATGYCVLASALVGTPVRRVIFNGASTAGWGLKGSAQTWPLYKDPAKHFSRQETTRTEEEIEDWMRRLLLDAERIRTALEGGQWSANAPDACTQFNSTCPYIDLCRSRATNRAILIKTTMKEEPWKGCTIEEAK